MSKELMIALGVGAIFILCMLAKRDFYSSSLSLRERVVAVEVKVKYLEDKVWPKEKTE